MKYLRNKSIFSALFTAALFSACDPTAPGDGGTGSTTGTSTTGNGNSGTGASNIVSKSYTNTYIQRLSTASNAVDSSVSVLLPGDTGSVKLYVNKSYTNTNKPYVTGVKLNVANNPYKVELAQVNSALGFSLGSSIGIGSSFTSGSSSVVYLFSNTSVYVLEPLDGKYYYDPDQEVQNDNVVHYLSGGSAGSGSFYVGFRVNYGTQSSPKYKYGYLLCYLTPYGTTGALTTGYTRYWRLGVISGKIEKNGADIQIQ